MVATASVAEIPSQTIDKEQALFDWALTNPFLTDRLMFDFLDAHDGSCSIAPVASARAVKAYINGSAIKEYTFALQVTLAVSNAQDNINVQNMYTLRKWQDWIEEQAKAQVYPDFGEKCQMMKLENVGNMPGMAQRFEGGTAKYQFFAKLTYLEVD